MSITEQKTLAKLIKNGWKDLALADQDDAAEMYGVIKDLLEALEKLEEGE